MVRKEILGLCENAIRKELGDLKGIPYDLANTIANVYYRFFIIADGVKQNELPTIFGREGNIFESLKSFIKEFHRLQFKLKVLPDLIGYLKRIDKLKQPNLYKLWLSVCYDYLKYDIHNAMKKNGIRRAIERVFKAKGVKEIPRLIDLFHT